MKFKYFGLYIFIVTLSLPLPMICSSIALIVMAINLLMVDRKTPIYFKSYIRDLFVIGCLLFFLLDSLRALFVFSLENPLIRDVRLSFVLLPILFIYKAEVIVSQFKNIIKLFVIGVFTYIILAWIYLGYYYTILHPTYNFEITDHLLKYIFVQEYPLAIHHTYIGMHITIAAIIIFNNKALNKKTGFSAGIPLLLFLSINSFFIGSKITTVLLLVLITLSTVISRLKKTSINNLKYYLVFLFTAILFGLYSIKDWLSISISSSFYSRIEIYQKTIKILKSNHPFFGIGKGQLNTILINDNIPEMGRLIPHNIYFNETLVNGFFGLIILSFLLVYYLIVAIRSKNMIMISFIILIISTGFLEDILVRQRGVLFFCFFASLFYTNYYYFKKR